MSHIIARKYRQIQGCTGFLLQHVCTCHLVRHFPTLVQITLKEADKAFQGEIPWQALHASSGPANLVMLSDVTTALSTDLCVDTVFMLSIQFLGFEAKVSCESDAHLMTYVQHEFCPKRFLLSQLLIPHVYVRDAAGFKGDRPCSLCKLYQIAPKAT